MHYHYEGDLWARDCKRCIAHTFAVPAGAAQIDIRFCFSSDAAHGIANLLTLTVLDSRGFRGAGHRAGGSHQVGIGTAGATPGYLPGPLPAGPWVVQIDTHMVMPGEPVHYMLDISVAEGAGGRDETTPLPVPPSRVASLRGAGWYRGDLHSHTHHSDAGERTVAELIGSARDAGLDFIFLTDHNTTAGLAEMDASRGDGLLTAGGIELTTFWGHALCLGTRKWVDWRAHPGSGEMARIAAAAYAHGQIFVIVHPQADGDPANTGGSWRYGEMMPGVARLVEIWNGPWGCNSNNERAVALWYDWLNQGLHLAATAGTDTHGAADYTADCGFNVVYAEALSEVALLRALLAGRLYLSAGPCLTFEAVDGRGERWMIGDTVAQPATFTLTWERCPADAQIRTMVHGRLLKQWTAGTQGRYAWEMAPEQADWVVAEIRDAGGGLLAITNPIYLQL